MASIVRYRDKWRAHIYKDGKRRSKTFKTKSDAMAWSVNTEHSLSGIKDSKQFFSDVLDRYALEVSSLKKSARWEKNRANFLKKYPISNKRISDITPQDVAAHRDIRLKEISASGVNRELNYISSVFQHCLTEWQLVSSNPVRAIKRPKNPRHRDRRISVREIDKILVALDYDSEITEKRHQVAVMFLLAIETGMRRGELSALKKQDVYLGQRYLKIIDSKNSDQRDVPLSLKAIELFELALSSIEGEEVFDIATESITTFFRRAVKLAKLEDLHFHDTRHEAVSRLAQKLELLDLARMIGHRDPRSLMVYYNPSASEIASRLD